MRRRSIDPLARRNLNSFAPVASVSFLHDCRNSQFSILYSVRNMRPRSRATGTQKDERSGFAGYVLRFNVRTEFLSQYQIRVVGDSTHREYWIPASDLADLNANMVGIIELVSEFSGKV